MKSRDAAWLVGLALVAGILGKCHSAGSGLAPAPFSPAGFEAIRSHDRVVGSGRMPHTGDICAVVFRNYWYPPNYPNGVTQPFSFTLGKHQVAGALEETLRTMHSGGLRHVVIPSSRCGQPEHHEYLPGEWPPVPPPGQSLEFDIELGPVTPP